MTDTILTMDETVYALKALLRVTTGIEFVLEAIQDPGDRKDTIAGLHVLESDLAALRARLEEGPL